MGGRKQHLSERWEYAVGQDGGLDLYRNGVAVGFLGRQFWYFRLGRRRGVSMYITVLPNEAEVEVWRGRTMEIRVRTGIHGTWVEKC
jgi:hypothetical protein